MRHARSIIKDSKKADGMDETAAANMTSEMTTLVNELKKQKEEMENKLKAVEDEKSKLKTEMESNLREADKKLVTAELDIVKKEKEEMATMIQKLEKAKKQMEEKLEDAKLETRSLKEELMETASVVQEFVTEKQNLETKLKTVEMSRDDIHMRLIEAESRAKKLKDEKRMKSMEISEYRKAGEAYAPLVEESQRQKRSISKELKRTEEEKFQLQSMLAGNGGNLLSVSEHPHQRQGRPLLSQHRSNSSNMLTDESYIQRPAVHRSSSMNMLTEDDFTNTNHMMSNLEQEIMMAQLHQAHQEEMSVISSCGLDIGDRPSGWLGTAIANRSFTNLIGMDHEDDGEESRRRHKRGSSSHSRSRHSSRSRSKSGSRKKSSSRHERKKDPSSSLNEKREKLRKSEKKVYDEMRKSRSSRSIDCDGSFGTLSADEFL